MHGLERSQRLVDEILAMVVGEVLGSNDSVHIRLHEFLDKVDLVEAIVASRLLDIKNGDDVFVVEVTQQLHLSQSSQTEHGVVEGGNLLDGHLLPGRLVNGRANNSVGSLANDILNVILLADVEGDFA